MSALSGGHVKNFRHDAVAGQVPGKNIVRIFGVNESIGTEQETVSGGPSVSYPWQGAAVALEAVSTSSVDNPAGIGAHTVLVESLDANFNQVFTLLDLDGLTPVPIAGTHRRVNLTVVRGVGEYAGTNAGEVSVQVSGGGDVLSTIPAGCGRSSDFAYSVPAGKRLMITQVIVDPKANKEALVNYWVRQQADVSAPPFGAKALVYRQQGLIGGHPVVTPLDLPFPLPEKSDVWIDGSFQQGTGSIICNANAILEDM